MGRTTWRLLVLVVALILSGCANPALPTSGGVAADNGAVAGAFSQHRSGIEVTAEGTVQRLLSDESSSTGRHQRFIMALSGSTQTLLVTNNVSIGTRVPVATGDVVIVHGEYEWNDQGGLVHFTHHDPQRTHEGGWIERLGVRYE